MELCGSGGGIEQSRWHPNASLASHGTDQTPIKIGATPAWVPNDPKIENAINWIIAFMPDKERPTAASHLQQLLWWRAPGETAQEPDLNRNVID